MLFTEAAAATASTFLVVSSSGKSVALAAPSNAHLATIKMAAWLLIRSAAARLLGWSTLQTTRLVSVLDQCVAQETSRAARQWTVLLKQRKPSWTRSKRHCGASRAIVAILAIRMTSIQYALRKGSYAAATSTWSPLIVAPMMGALRPTANAVASCLMDRSQLDTRQAALCAVPQSVAGICQKTRLLVSKQWVNETRVQLQRWLENCPMSASVDLCVIPPVCA